MADTVTISKALLQRLREYTWTAHEYATDRYDEETDEETVAEWLKDCNEAYEDYLLVGRLLDGLKE